MHCSSIVSFAPRLSKIGYNCKKNVNTLKYLKYFPLNSDFLLQFQNLFYSESKLSNSKREGSDGIIYRRIPASGLIEDRLKYIRRKNEVKCRVQPPNVESCQVLGRHIMHDNYLKFREKLLIL